MKPAAMVLMLICMVCMGSAAFAEEKDPAKAYRLDLFTGGLGHMYAGDMAGGSIGLLLEAVMVTGVLSDPAPSKFLMILGVNHMLALQGKKVVTLYNRKAAILRGEEKGTVVSANERRIPHFWSLAAAVFYSYQQGNVADPSNLQTLAGMMTLAFGSATLLNWSPVYLITGLFFHEMYSDVDSGSGWSSLGSSMAVAGMIFLNFFGIVATTDSIEPTSSASLGFRPALRLASNEVAPSVALTIRF